MTPDEFIKKQKALFDLIIKQDLPLQRAAQSTHRMQTTRIFQDGKNSSGGQIGQYDTTHPLYGNPKKTPGNKYKPEGKGGKASGFAIKSQSIKTRKEKTVLRGELFKNGKPRKTKYFHNYKELRNTIGRRIDKVDLFYTGDLKSDFSNTPINSPDAKPLKINVHEYIAGIKLNTKRKPNADKVEGLENKYGKIFTPTKEEVANFFKKAGEEWDLMVKQSLK